MRWRIAAVLVAAVALPAMAQRASERLPAWTRTLVPANVAVVVNSESADSVALGEYYRKARRIPPRNLIQVGIPGRPSVLSSDAFARIKREIDARLDSSIEIVVLAWTAPYAVECNSITAAMTHGFQADVCANTCKPTKASPYFDSAAGKPYSELGMRLTMLLPSEPLELGRALVDRGVRADGSWPDGAAYLLQTSDPARNSRAIHFPPTATLTSPRLRIQRLRAEEIRGRSDVMFYFTGAVHVGGLETLGFPPGAIADHLTSSGGDLFGTAQMSSLRWLEAGATATYGTVSEPCNHPQKFPSPAILMKHYLAGATAIEAYWKSVAWPAQGLFIGEPLASPYRRAQ